MPGTSRFRCLLAAGRWLACSNGVELRTVPSPVAPPWPQWEPPGWLVRRGEARAGFCNGEIYGAVFR